MLSFNQIIQISKMFDPSINVSLYEHNLDLEDDMDWNYNEYDCPLSAFHMTVDEFDFSRNTIDEEPMSPQSQIRNHDCMWSGRCTTHPNECQLGGRNNCNTKYLNESETKKPTQNVSNSNANGTQHIQSKQPLANVQSMQQTHCAQKKQQQQQNIPAGRSLLRLNQMKQPVVIKVPNVSTNDFLKDRDFIARPDTPLSLDDDPPEFKHASIELAACTMGSNEMSLVTESNQTEIINILKEHLQDHNSSQMEVRDKLSNYLPSIKTNESIDDIYKDIKSFADFQDDFEDEEEDAAIESDSSFIATNNTSNSNSNTLSSSIGVTHSLANNNTMNTTQYENTQSMHSDHSYTRSKSRVDVIGLGVQTPSDSGKYLSLYFFKITIRLITSSIH